MKNEPNGLVQKRNVCHVFRDQKAFTNEYKPRAHNQDSTEMYFVNVIARGPRHTNKQCADLPWKISNRK